MPVSLATAGSLTVAGDLCWDGPSPSATVQLLIPGGAYNRTYWDFPYEPDTYSYVRAATGAGYTTLVIDRLGTGTSSHPLGTQLNFEAHAEAAHQVISALRAGQIGPRAFTRVVLVGHSYGSGVVWYEGATYRDVDAFIITGLLHGLTVSGAAAIATYIHPAVLDPKFAGSGVDPSYITTIPGKREPFFYAPGADPNVIATDEATKDTATATEVAEIPPAIFASGKAQQLTAPVLLAVGTKDMVFCGLGGADCSTAESLVAQERPFYGRAPCLDAWLMPGAGHDLNTSPGAPEWFAAAIRWTDRIVGPDGGAPRC